MDFNQYLAQLRQMPEFKDVTVADLNEGLRITEQMMDDVPDADLTDEELFQREAYYEYLSIQEMMDLEEDDEESDLDFEDPEYDDDGFEDLDEDYYMEDSDDDYDDY